MSFRLHRPLNQYPLQENHLGSMAVNSQQQTYNSYTCLQPGLWVWQKQKFGEQQGYDDQSQIYKNACVTYYQQAPWSFTQHQNDYNELQAHYNVESFRGHSRAGYAIGCANHTEFNPNLSNELFADNSNDDRRTYRVEMHNPRQAVQGMSTPFYALS